MARTLQKYTVFIASPGDLGEERQIVRNVCDELSRNSLVSMHNVRLEAGGWEDVIPGAGRPQDLINQLSDDCDIFICLFHQRFGSDTGKAASGTLEEFLNAYADWKHNQKPYIMLYFKDIKMTPQNRKDPQVNAVMDFRDEVEQDKLVLYGNFGCADDFRSLVKGHLEQWIAENCSSEGGSDKLAGQTEMIRQYLEALQADCTYMDIDWLQEEGRPVMIRLPEIFIPLQVSRPGQILVRDRDSVSDSETDSKRQERVDIAELIAGCQHAVIEGPPGSGKTTLFKHIVYHIAAQKPLYGLEAWLPVLIPLKDIRVFLEESRGQNTAVTLEEILGHYFSLYYPFIGAEPFAGYCREQQVLFLLDGLDEIEKPCRDMAAMALHNFQINCPGVKIVFSGRPHGITGEVLKKFGRLHLKIEDFNQAQVEEFVGRWFRYAYGRSEAGGGRTAAQMIADVRAHTGLSAFIGNPLMLTAICILYNNEKKLPNQRAELYYKFIIHLLYSKFKEPDKVFTWLKKLAFQAHGQGRGIDGKLALEVLREVYAPYEKEGWADYNLRTRCLFDDIEPRCGLLKLEGGRYVFWHYTFQEFLTALYLVDNNKYYDRAIADYWDKENYREVIKLFIGYLSIANRNWANDIVADVMGTVDAPFTRQMVAVEAFVDMQEVKRETGVVQQVQARLVHIITADDYAPKERVEAGENLGRLGDPRDLRVFVPVAGGVYDLEERGQVELAGFELAKYPVTNRWYGEFMAAGGYDNREYWSGAGKKWLQTGKRKQPVFWNDRQYNCPNQPVVGVTWYEAAAFTCWLTLSRRDGWLYRLPGDSEWQAAAAGKEKRHFPWGQEWEADRCNCFETGIHKLSAVGIFKSGDTPVAGESGLSISDLGGNVWEWIAGKDDNEEFFLRGGGWCLSYANCRCACRYYLNPDYYVSDTGFRCVRAVTRQLL